MYDIVDPTQRHSAPFLARGSSRTPLEHTTTSEETLRVCAWPSFARSLAASLVVSVLWQLLRQTEGGTSERVGVGPTDPMRSSCCGSRFTTHGAAARNEKLSASTLGVTSDQRTSMTSERAPDPLLDTRVSSATICRLRCAACKPPGFAQGLLSTVCGSIGGLLDVGARIRAFQVTSIRQLVRESFCID